ncbi:MAG: DUF3300 domain-containing protein [Pseudomonadota bacterium]
MQIRHHFISALCALLTIALAPVAERAMAQGVDASAAPSVSAAWQVREQPEVFAPHELELLVAPYALYPDDLLAIVLAASAYPLQVVEANRFVNALPAVAATPPAHWDDAIVALLNYPDALALLASDLESTRRLGLALVHQRNNVLAAAARFRHRAYRAGNLRSDAYQQVTVEEDIITVEPADHARVYVPDYDPARVVVRQRR